MSQNRLPPPESEACLFRLRSSTQKGGTLIAEEVTDHAAHERRICDPDGYRPAFCPRCGERRLHVHDYRERVLRAEPGKPVAMIRAESWRRSAPCKAVDRLRNQKSSRRMVK
ncbi:MAG: hypothetical protein DMG39_10140 [Acidobacteria bacterium]|nr:MAG: hypothetical protein DMG39_10140 [Acidobacteriota bacterium]